jgi:cytochrome d ubiquinol oxidase subunit I
MSKDGQPWFIDGVPVLRAEILDFWQLVFNPSTMHRLVHVWIGCFIMGSFFIMSISAWYLLRGRHLEFARRSFRGALVLATVSSVAALVHGHFQADSVYRQQPAKVAAFEAHYETGRGDLVLFGLPDDASQTLKAKVAIPGGLSFLLHGNFETEVVGLDRFRPEDRPPVLVPFLSFHLMIGIGCAFILLTLLACCLLPGGRLFRQRWLLWIFVVAIVPAVAANQAGWAVAEVGRQPWIVHPPTPFENGRLKLGADGYVDYPTVTVTLPDGRDYTTVQGLRTDDAVSKAVVSSQVVGSIAGFGFIYLLLAAVWLFVLDRKIRHGPDPLPGETEEGTDAGGGILEAAADRLGHARRAEDEGERAPGGTA